MCYGWEMDEFSREQKNHFDDHLGGQKIHFSQLLFNSVRKVGGVFLTCFWLVPRWIYLAFALLLAQPNGCH
jgi:hypothetical protein